MRFYMRDTTIRRRIIYHDNFVVDISCMHPYGMQTVTRHLSRVVIYDDYRYVHQNLIYTAEIVRKQSTK